MHIPMVVISYREFHSITESGYFLKRCSWIWYLWSGPCTDWPWVCKILQSASSGSGRVEVTRRTRPLENKHKPTLEFRGDTLVHNYYSLHFHCMNYTSERSKSYIVIYMIVAVAAPLAESAVKLSWWRLCSGGSSAGGELRETGLGEDSRNSTRSVVYCF